MESSIVALGFWGDQDEQPECPACGHDGKEPYPHQESWGDLYCGKCGHKIK